MTRAEVAGPALLAPTIHAARDLVEQLSLVRARAPLPPHAPPLQHPGRRRQHPKPVNMMRCHENSAAGAVQHSPSARESLQVPRQDGPFLTLQPSTPARALPLLKVVGMQEVQQPLQDTPPCRAATIRQSPHPQARPALPPSWAAVQSGRWLSPLGLREGVPRQHAGWHRSGPALGRMRAGAAPLLPAGGPHGRLRRGPGRVRGGAARGRRRPGALRRRHRRRRRRLLAPGGARARATPLRASSEAQSMGCMGCHATTGSGNAQLLPLEVHALHACVRKAAAPEGPCMQS